MVAMVGKLAGMVRTNPNQSPAEDSKVVLSADLVLPEVTYRVADALAEPAEVGALQEREMLCAGMLLVGCKKPFGTDRGAAIPKSFCRGTPFIAVQFTGPAAGTGGDGFVVSPEPKPSATTLP